MKVVAAMSGGVDSSVAAALLLFLYFASVVMLYFAAWVAVREGAPATQEEVAYAGRKTSGDPALPLAASPLHRPLLRPILLGPPRRRCSHQPTPIRMTPATAQSRTLGPDDDESASSLDALSAASAVVEAVGSGDDVTCSWSGSSSDPTG